MKKGLYLLAAIMFVACSKNDEAEVLMSDADMEVYQQAFDDAVSFIEADASIDINTTVEFVKTLEGVTNVAVEDSIVRVTIQGGVNFTIDFYEHPDDYTYDSFNENAFQSYLDSIDNATDNNIPSGYEKTDEVFKDYLSTITRSVGIPDGESTTRASSNNQKVRLTRRNAAIWAPLGGEYQEESNRIIKIANSTLANEKRKMKVLQGFSPSVFTSFSEYDIVYFSYHGDKDGVISLPSRMLTQEERIQYEEEVKQKRVEKRIRVKDSKSYIDRYILLDAFWEKYLPDLSNTIIFSCVCYLGVDNSHFLKVCRQKNVADFFAADDECRAKKIVDCFQKFYPLFMRGNCSTKTAFKPFSDFFFYEGLGYTFNYKRFGTKTVYYITSHATGVGNRTANSQATRSSDESSSIVVNAQLRYATEESDDILKTIEAGVCLQDMETKQVTLIPFSSKNIVSNEKKSYGDVTVSNIAASLDNLIDEHQYAYCCYTKVDGVITLSDETYKITTNNVLSFKLHLLSKTEERYVDDSYAWYDHEHAGQTVITEDEKTCYLEIKIKEGTFRFIYNKSPNLIDYLSFPNDDRLIENNITFSAGKVYVNYVTYEWEYDVNHIKFYSQKVYRNGDDETFFEISDIFSTPKLIFSYNGIYTTSVSGIYHKTELISYECTNE